MNIEEYRKNLLDQLTSVPKLLNLSPVKSLALHYPRPYIIEITRQELQTLRDSILAATDINVEKIDINPDLLAERIALRIRQRFEQSVAPAINATGIILHTALGRAPLCEAAQEAISLAIKNYCTIAINRETGKRGDRYSHVEELLCYLTGAEAACVVNNNAAATMLVLNTLAFQKEVIISRGQLVEIGGSFRIPDVMQRSQAHMVEVGTTNKTHLRDYEQAINANTGLLLRVHTSNYQIIGFASEVPLSQLVQLAAKHQLPLMDDIGSGCLIDFRKYGLPEEPMVQESIKAGADVVTFSGDKILGGPQCGIIIGKKFCIDLIRKNPLTRALRCGKLTYTALEATLKLYLDEETLPEKHPVLKMLTTPIKELKNRARAFQRHFQDSLRKVCELAVIDGFSQMGSGSLPAKNIPSVLIALKPINMSADELAKNLRTQKPSVFTRIEADLVLLDFRTIAPDEVKLVEEAVLRIFEL